MKMEYMQKKNMQSNASGGEPDGDGSFVDGYLLYIMAQASEAVSRSFHAQLSEAGVAVPTWRVLASLYPDRALNVGDLARKCLIKQPTLTRQLDRLCDEGLTVRSHERTDRRGVLVSLTAEGRARAAQYVARAKLHERHVLEGYSEAEIATLKAMLTDLIDHARLRG